jgi:uncharacterized delta-60 repeat protein
LLNSQLFWRRIQMHSSFGGRGRRIDPIHRFVHARQAIRLESLECRQLLAAGDFDLTFGGGTGGTKVDFAVTGTGSDFARAMAIQPGDGKIVLAGTTGSGGNTDDRIALVRLNKDGSLDNSFDGDGRSFFPVLPGDVDINAVAVSPLDGKIVVVGTYFPSTSTTGDWLVARFNTNGSIDNTFSGDGIFTLDGGSNFTDTLNGVTVQNDGKIITVGVAQQSTSNLATQRRRGQPAGGGLHVRLLCPRRRCQSRPRRRRHRPGRPRHQLAGQQQDVRRGRFQLRRARRCDRPGHSRDELAKVGTRPRAGRDASNACGRCDNQHNSQDVGPIASHSGSITCRLIRQTVADAHAQGRMSGRENTTLQQTVQTADGTQV